MDVRILLNENSKLYHLLTLEMDGFDGFCRTTRCRIFLVRCVRRVTAFGLHRADAPLTSPNSKQDIRFTVLSRAYWCADTFGRTLMCLEHQAYCNFDVVVAEDGVWSVCADVVREYGNSLVLTHLPLGRDAGRNVVANAAMAVTKEPWWVFLDFCRLFRGAGADHPCNPGLLIDRQRGSGGRCSGVHR